MATIFTLEISEIEIDALISWHLNAKYKYAEREEYTDAEYHRKRALELEKRKQGLILDKTVESMT